MRALATLALAAALAAGPAAAGTPYYRYQAPAAQATEQSQAQSAATADAAAAAAFAAPFAADASWGGAVAADVAYAEVPGFAALQAGLSSGPGADGNSVPMTRAKADAPAWRVLYNRFAWRNLYSGAWKPTGNDAATEAQILASSQAAFPYPYHTYVSQSPLAFVLPASYTPIRRLADGTAPPVIAPDGIAPSGNADSQMVVFQPDGSAFESYATIVLSNRTIVCLTYQFTDPAKAGDGYQNGTTASMIPVYAGLIRRDEAAALSIGHALKAVVPAAMLATAFTYPALTFDRGALTENPPYSGSLPMGARLAIPASVPLSGLGLTSPAGMAVAVAAQRYGVIVTDRGGSGVTLIREAGADFPDSAGLDADLARIAAALRQVAAAR